MILVTFLLWAVLVLIYAVLVFVAIGLAVGIVRLIRNPASIVSDIARLFRSGHLKRYD